MASSAADRRLLEGFRADPECVVAEAADHAGVLRIRREVEGRAWAVRHGIPTAETVTADPEGRWLVSRRVPDEDGEPADYVAAALETARRIQHAPEPRFAVGAASWHAPRRGRAWRLARLAAHGIDLRAFAAARDAALRLPREATAHHDFHRGNVLNSLSLGRVTVIDWEHLGPGPRHHDLVRLIVELTDPVVARTSWEALLAETPRTDHGPLAAQLRWLALRTLAGAVLTPRRERDVVELRRLTRRAELAAEWSAELAPATIADQL